MTTRQSTPNRRQFMRQPLSVTVRVGKGDNREARPITVVGRTRDVSTRGVYLWAPDDFRVGEVLRLQIDVPLEPAGNTGLHVCCTAEILRIDPGNLVQGRAGVGLAVRVLQFDVPQFLSQPPTIN